MAARKISGIAIERRGEGEPLLLLHGTGGSRAHWRPVVDRLAPHRELLLVDLPGHGESDLPSRPESHTPIGYAAVLAGLLDELAIPSAPHIAGNSVGAWTALELSKLGRARSVVALSPAGLWARHDPWRCTAQLWTEHKMGRVFAPLVPRLMRSEVGRSALLRSTLANPRKIPPDEAVEMATTFAATRGFDAHIAQTRRQRFRDGQGIDVPVTVAWGDKERLIPSKARRRDDLPAHTNYVTLPDCGHSPMWDNPELVSRTILEGAADRYQR
jgi:pimeloyl-ACP methyl ester carboxylesterase